MTMWKAQVTERKTFLEIAFDDEEAFYGPPCLFRSKSAPQLKTACNDTRVIANSRIMLDEFSGYADNTRCDETKTDAQEIASDLSDLASTTEPADESVSETEPQGSLQKKLDNYQIGKRFSSEVGATDDIIGEDQIGFQADSYEMWESELYQSGGMWESESSIVKRKPRPCKGQRERYRKTVMRLMNEVEQNPDFNIRDAYLPPSLANDDWRRQNLEAKLQAHQKRIQLERDTNALLRPLILREYHAAQSVTLEEVFARGQSAHPRRY